MLNLVDSLECHSVSVDLVFSVHCTSTEDIFFWDFMCVWSERWMCEEQQQMCAQSVAVLNCRCEGQRNISWCNGTEETRLSSPSRLFIPSTFICRIDSFFFFFFGIIWVNGTSVRSAVCIPYRALASAGLLSTPAWSKLQEDIWTSWLWIRRTATRAAWRTAFSLKGTCFSFIPLSFSSPSA